MFAGIVEESACVCGIEKNEKLTRLWVESTRDLSATKLGDSIAIEGVCLTVVQRDGSRVLFELSPETLRRSTLGNLVVGSPVNFERSLKLGDRIDGHLVFGHVDTTVILRSRRPDGDCERLEWEMPGGISGFIAEKGSVSLAGVSLTVGEKGPDWFSVYIIPHTAQITTLSTIKPGMRVNFEIDMLARYVNAALRGQTAERSSGIGEDFLRIHGYIK